MGAQPNDREEFAKVLLQYGANAIKAEAGITHGTLMPYQMAKGELQGLLGFSNEVHKAIDALDFRALTSLLEDGTDLSEPDEQGRTPLHAAAPQQRLQAF